MFFLLKKIKCYVNVQVVVGSRDVEIVLLFIYVMTREGDVDCGVIALSHSSTTVKVVIKT